MSPWRNKSNLWHTSSREEQSLDGINCKSHEGIKESNMWWHGGAWVNFYKVNSFHPIINRSSIINLSNAGKVRGLCQHIWRSSIASHRDVIYLWRGATDCEIHPRVKLPYLGTCGHSRHVICRWGPKQGMKKRGYEESSTFQALFIKRISCRRRQSPAELYDHNSTNSTATDQSLYIDTNNNPRDRKEKR